MPYRPPLQTSGPIDRTPGLPGSGKNKRVFEEQHGGPFDRSSCSDDALRQSAVKNGVFWRNSERGAFFLQNWQWSSLPQKLQLSPQDGIENVETQLCCLKHVNSLCSALRYFFLRLLTHFGIWIVCEVHISVLMFLYFYNLTSHQSTSQQRLTQPGPGRARVGMKDEPHEVDIWICLPFFQTCFAAKLTCIPNLLQARFGVKDGTDFMM